MNSVFVSLTAATAACVSVGAANVAFAQEVEPAAVSTAAKSKEKKITDRNHPDYVKCRSERVIGSLAQRKRTCMTNREWKLVATEGNKRATELVVEMRANATSGN